MAEKRPFRIVLGDGSPKSALGGSLSRYVPPGAQYDYNPPSVFVRYKILSAVFGLLVLALLAYGFLAPHHPRSSTAPSRLASPDPVYVEPLPAAPRP